MAAIVLDGKAIAAQWRKDIAEETEALKLRGDLVPGLGVVLVGDDPASLSYVTAKERACATVGFLSREHRLPVHATEKQVLETVKALNNDPAIHGILVQLPLPPQIREEIVIEAIDPGKDVDGFTPVNVGRMLIGKTCFLPCTPNGIVRMLIAAGIKTEGRHAVIVGRSNIVGKPLAHLLMRKAPGGNATVTVCHTATRDLAAFTSQADILVVAAGRPNTVTGGMVKPGAAVIDVGVNRIPDPESPRGYRLAGDVDFATVKNVAGWITPVPGGVGPLTIAMLLRNTLTAACRRYAGQEK